MTLTLDLTREEEARLAAAAQEQGTAPVEVLRTLIRQHLPSLRENPGAMLLRPEPGEGDAFYQTATPEEWSRAWRAWAASHEPQSPGLSNEAISRDSIYEGRG